MEDLVKPIDAPNTVTVGSVCLSCGLLSTKTCPYGNHNKASVLQYTGDMRGKCSYYQPILNAKENNSMIKTAKDMSDAELNIEIYRRIFAMDKDLQEDTKNYWEYLFPSGYAEEMVDTKNKSGGQDSDKGRKTTVMKEEPKKKDKEEKKDKDEATTKAWFKKKNNGDKDKNEK